MNADLEDMDVDGVFNALVNYRIPPIVAQRFKEQMIDGHIILKMNAIPVTLIPEIGIQIKFCDFYEELTGKTIEYPPEYQPPTYAPIAEYNTLPAAQQRTQQLPQAQQPMMPANNNGPRIPVPYPAPLPEFSDYVEHMLQSNDCLKVVHLMNRELVDYYNQSNYDLGSVNANRNICQTVLDSYPLLQQTVQHVMDVENHVRQRRNNHGAWSFLSKKLAYRKQYIKNKMNRALLQAALTNVDITTIARVVQTQPGLFNSTPIAFQRQLIAQRAREAANAIQRRQQPVNQQQEEEEEEEDEATERDEITENLVNAAAEAEYNAANNNNTDLTVEREETVDENNNIIQVDENNNEIVIRGTADDHQYIDENNNNQHHENNNIYVDENNNRQEINIYTEARDIVLSETQEDLLKQIDDLVEQQQLQSKSTTEENNADDDEPPSEQQQQTAALDLTSSSAVFLNSFDNEPRFD